MTYCPARYNVYLCLGGVWCSCGAFLMVHPGAKKNGCVLKGAECREAGQPPAEPTVAPQQNTAQLVVPRPQKRQEKGWGGEGEGKEHPECGRQRPLRTALGSCPLPRETVMGGKRMIIKWLPFGPPEMMAQPPRTYVDTSTSRR